MQNRVGQEAYETVAVKGKKQVKLLLRNVGHDSYIPRFRGFAVMKMEI